MKKAPKPVETSREKTGFTLLELLVVMATTSVLAGLLFPAVSGAAGRAGSTVCLNNLKQIQSCWLLYGQDHDDFVPPNLSSNRSGIWRSTPDSWIGNSSAVHDRDTRAIENGLLFRYDYNRVPAVYRCPSDRSRTQAARGQPAGPLRTRSYSMSGCLGGRESEIQAVAQRTADIPEPTRLFVFVDEHEDSIDDAHFLTWPDPDDRWVNMPAGRHGQGANLAFADGHVEHWRWAAAKTFRDKDDYWKSCANEKDLADLRRLQAATLPLLEQPRRQ